MKKFIKILIILLPPALFLSYHPVISLGSDSAMNFEFSIAEIWLLVFFLASLPFAKKIAKFYGWKKLSLAAAIPFYFSLSVIWSTNRVRTLLTAGLFWLIVFATLNLIYWLKKDSRSGCALAKSLIITAVVASVFCWLQCILDLAGISREYTLLCQGCVTAKFGFPHPNGFAIEPQFMGNLLLAPVLLCFYLIINPSISKIIKTRSHKIILVVITIFLTATLFLTFSRGAIYAFVVALVAEIILTIIFRRKLTQKFSVKIAIFKPIIIAVAAFGISLCAQGVFATLAPTNDTFYSGIAKSIHQLSLGKIDLRPAEPATPTAAESSAQTSQFSGYVAESTDVRLNLNQIAFNAWRSQPQYILVGTGLGGAGNAMHQAFPDEIGSKEIVQNQYISLLLETGIVGWLIIVVIMAVTTRIVIIKNKKSAKISAIKALFAQPLSPLLVSVILAFLLTLLFFSGLPNAIHIYLFPLIFI